MNDTITAADETKETKRIRMATLGYIPAKVHSRQRWAHHRCLEALRDKVRAKAERLGVVVPTEGGDARGYGPPARPVVVPLRKQVPQSPDADVVPAEVDAAPAAESWRCGNCHHLQAIGSVSHCEFCGAHRSQQVPR